MSQTPRIDEPARQRMLARVAVLAAAVLWSTSGFFAKLPLFDAWLMIEAFGLALPEIGAATKIWPRMYPSKEQLARYGPAFMKQQCAKRWK